MTTTTRLTRLDAGLYETHDGHVLESKLRNLDGMPDDGYGTDGWLITCPGEAGSDNWVGTLREAREIDWSSCYCHG